MKTNHRNSPLLPHLLLCLAFGVLGTASAWAQDTLTFSADRTESVFAEGRERLLLRGSARVESDDFAIAADVIGIYGEGQRYVRSTGGVTVLDLENDLFLTSEEFFLDRETNYLRANGNAYMEDRENDLVVKGGTIQNWDELDLTEISVNVRILGEDYTARSQFARYRRANEQLELSGTPELFWRGDEYRATRISIDLANDEIDFVDVRATVRSTEEETPDATDAAPATPSDATGANAAPPDEEAP